MTELREPLEEVVRNVYATMLETPVAPSAARVPGFPEPLTGAVYYAGAWKGALAIECSTAQAKRWAASWMPLAGPATLEDARDGLAELANMIAGNLKPLLPPGVSLSMPSVVEGLGHRLRVLGKGRQETLEFDDGTEQFRIRLVVEPADAAA